MDGRCQRHRGCVPGRYTRASSSELAFGEGVFYRGLRLMVISRCCLVPRPMELWMIVRASGRSSCCVSDLARPLVVRDRPSTADTVCGVLEVDRAWSKCERISTPTNRFHARPERGPNEREGGRWQANATAATHTLGRRSRLKPVPSPGVTQKLWGDAREALRNGSFAPERYLPCARRTDHVLAQASSEGLGWKHRLHDTCCIRGVD